MKNFKNTNVTVNNVIEIEDEILMEEILMEDEILMEAEKMNNGVVNLNMELPDTDAAAGIIDRMMRNNKNGVFIGNTWGINYRGYEIIPVTDSYQATWLSEVTLGVILLDDDGYPVSFEPEAYQYEFENNILVTDRDVYKDEEVYGQMVACRKIASVVAKDKEETVMVKNIETNRELIFLEKEVNETFKYVEYSLCYSDGIVITIFKRTKEFIDTYNEYRKDPNRKRYNKTYLLHYLDLLMKNKYVIHEIMVRDEVSADKDPDFDIMLEYLPKQICGGYNRLIKFLRDFDDEVSKNRYSNKFCNKNTFDECGEPFTSHVIECIVGTFRDEYI
jgi:hypothetical protein